MLKDLKIIIRLKWHIFEDDNLITRPFIQPIYKEINKRAVNHLYEKQENQLSKVI